MTVAAVKIENLTKLDVAYLYAANSRTYRYEVAYSTWRGDKNNPVSITKFVVHKGGHGCFTSKELAAQDFEARYLNHLTPRELINLELVEQTINL